MSTQEQRDRTFRRAQAQYDAALPPEWDEDDEREAVCAHCGGEACGSWSDDEMDEDGAFHSGEFRCPYPCDKCDGALCTGCIDGETDAPCPKDKSKVHGQS